MNKFRSLLLIGAAIAALGLSTPSMAQHAGAHVGVSVGAHGYYGGGGYRGGYGGYRGGYYGGYGWRGGYYGGYGWRGGYWGPWGLGWGGLGLGLYFSALPLYYSTLYWDGVPYYYADNTYYRWNQGVSQYETVAPPNGGQGQPATGGAGADLIAYPKNGQSEEQQGKDKYECHSWAAGQTGFDPTKGSGAAAGGGQRSDYLRAQAACLEGRGYSVK
jgi:hypothetical protein